MTTYTWDPEDRITGLVLPAGTIYTMAYDADGLRRRRQDSDGEANFIWDGEKVLLETDAEDAAVAKYTLSEGVFGDLLSQRRGDTSSFFDFDALGSTMELSAVDGTTISDTYRHKAFGELLASTGSTVNPFRFVGALGYYDEADVGMQYLSARWYRPGDGRFVSAEALAMGGDVYRYGGNAPANVVDPSGQHVVDGYGYWWDFFHIFHKHPKKPRRPTVEEFVRGAYGTEQSCANFIADLRICSRGSQLDADMQDCCDALIALKGFPGGLEAWDACMRALEKVEQESVEERARRYRGT